MAPIAVLWMKIVYAFDFLTGSFGGPTFFEQGPALQIPIAPPQPQAKRYPIFSPPDEIEATPFQCEYPEYLEEDGWVACNSNTNRQCWLRNQRTGQEYNITTDYELEGPKGIVREYYLEVASTHINPDGYGDVYAQLFNGSYPGPRLQACWGDQLRITVKNMLVGNGTVDDPGNGTSVHWHGFRQLHTNPSDGVNVVTQCPTAPGDSFTYIFNITQYGTSWYHSHYSLQYPSGALGPITLYGPSSKDFDHQLSPIIISDWLHNSVWAEWELNRLEGGSIFVDNILQNGIGQWPLLNDGQPVTPGTKFNEVYFQQGVRYLMRLINGATDTSFVFSIDNHHFWVISSDFVSIEPYYTDHIMIGIGQRYNIIVEAKPDVHSTDVNFWMRTTPAPNCTLFHPNGPIPQGNNGIIRYSRNDDIPTTSRQDFTLNCADETYFRDLVPIVPWEVSTKRQHLPTFYLSLNTTSSGYPYYPCDEQLVRFQLVQDAPVWLNWTSPSILNPYDDYATKPWLAVVRTEEDSYNDWIQITIISGTKPDNHSTNPLSILQNPTLYIPDAHPMHLHGHDFAILAQCVPDGQTACDHPKTARLHLHNPPRRDVALLPDNGYLILAFRADNPGAWLLHCHIAFHASFGLAAQILESVDRWPATFGRAWDRRLEEGCRRWDAFTPDNASDPCQRARPHVLPLQIDSGI